jgi:integrase/recombinase XerD
MLSDQMQLVRSFMMQYADCIMGDQKRSFKPPWHVTRSMFLSEDEAAQLLRHLRAVREIAGSRRAALAARDRLLIEALLFSGLRNRELCQLTIGDTVVGIGHSAFLVRGTPRQDRTVHVPQPLSLLVQDFVHTHRPQLVLNSGGRKATSEALLVNDRGRPFERTSLYRRIVAVLTAAGLGLRATAQRLRHTYGYLAYKRSGGNLLFVQRQMGHAHPMVTSVYAQFVEENYPAIADRLAESSPASLLPAPLPQRPNEKKENRRVRSRRNS